MNYLMIDGAGDPNTSVAYQAAVEALFVLSYSIKFKAKKGTLAIDYGVMPLEGLWWTDDNVKLLGRRQIQLEVDGDDYAADLHQQGHGGCRH